MRTDRELQTSWEDAAAAYVGPDGDKGLSLLDFDPNDQGEMRFLYPVLSVGSMQRQSKLRAYIRSLREKRQQHLQQQDCGWKVVDENKQPAFTAELTNGCFVSTTDFLQTWKKKLFVRDCYPKLYKESLRQFELEKQAVFIVGTPGIGKSCFLDYLLVKYVSQNQKVLYLSGPRNKAYLFSQHGRVFEAGLEAAGLDALKPDEFDVVLFDPHEVATETNVVHRDHLHGKPVFVSMSPDPENCKKLRKDLQNGGLFIDLYMGTQPLEEAQKMREACYPKLSAETVSKRHKSFGGVARFLYEPGKGKLDVLPATVASKQEAALNDMVTNPLRIDTLIVRAGFKSLWSLYHLQPLLLEDGEIKWDECTVEICCDDAHARIRDKLLEREVRELWNMFCSTRNTEGTLRGIRYEAYAHKKIMQSGLLGTAQSLTKAGVGKGTIEVEIPSGLDSSMAIGGKVGGKKAILNLQMKAGRSGDLSKEAANAMKTTNQDILIFIVPDGTVMRKALEGSPKMKQYRMIVSEMRKASTKKRKREATTNKNNRKAKMKRG